MLIPILFFISGLALAACAAYLVFKFREKTFERMLSEKDMHYNRLIAEKDAYTALQSAEKEKTFSAAIATLKEQFSNLAAEKLQERSEDLTLLNKTNLETALKPLKEQFVRLEEITRKAQTENENLGKTMTKDVDAIGKIARDLSGVASALSSNTRIQGRKGEDILAEKLRQAGLEENINFFLQHGTDTDRPDVQVCDPENRWLVIDSKVSLSSFLEYELAENPAEKSAKLSAHITSVRTKVDQLIRKKYPASLQQNFPERNYLPVTAMFIPYEAPLHVAIKNDPSLLQYAAENNVVIVTPLTLLAYLRLVYLAWQHEKESRNQQMIVNTARELLERTNSFLCKFESVGESIEKLQEAYIKAQKSIVEAPNARTIASSAKKLIKLHVRLENGKGQKIKRAQCLLDDDDETEANQLPIQHDNH